MSRRLADGSTIYPSSAPRADAALRHGRVLRHRPGPDAQGRAGDAAAAVRPRGAAADSRRSSSPRRCRNWRPSGAAAGRRRTASSGSAPTAPPGAADYAPRRGLAPYYNTLDPRVQEAMLAVVREVVERYAQHPSFAGLALRLSAYGYAQLPGPEWGMDDATIARFEHDTRREGARRRARRVSPPGRPSSPARPQRRQWLEWRPAQLHAVLSPRPGNARRGPARRPALPGRGRDARRPGARGRAAARRCRGARRWPNRCCTPASTCGSTRTTRASCCCVPSASSPRTAQRAGGGPGNRPDARGGPLLPGTATAGQPVLPSAAGDPHPVVRPEEPVQAELHLAGDAAGSRPARRTGSGSSTAWPTMDSQVMVDGGWLLPLGQEDSLPRPGGGVPPAAGGALRRGERTPRARRSQPVTFRYATCAGRTYVYAVNDAPFAVTAQVRSRHRPSCRLQELTGLRRIAPLKRENDRRCWTVELEPYDLVAVELSEPGVEALRSRRCRCPAAVETALRQRIRQLGAQGRRALRSPPPLPRAGESGLRAAGDGRANPCPAGPCRSGRA